MLVGDCRDNCGDGRDVAKGFLPERFRLGRCSIVANGFPSAFDLTTLDGTNGFAIDGIEADDNIGGAIGAAGDINNDGFDDFIIGAPFRDFRGGAYILFGSETGFGSRFNLAELTGANGFFLEGTSASDLTFFPGGIVPTPTPTFSFSGVSIDGVGDLDNDGFDDIAIGSPGGGSSEVHVLYGGEQFPDELSVDDDIDGNNGFEIEEPDFDFFGVSVSGAGDFNDDGFADLVVSATGFDNDPGEAYVIFGSTAGFPAELDVATLGNGEVLRLVGTAPGEDVGQSVSDTGDVNGDGIDDVLVGAPSGNFSDLDTRSYVVFGSRNGFPDEIMLSDLNGSDGFALVGLDPDDLTGWSVSSAGDINADGIADLLVGAPEANANGDNSGQVYVVFGSQAGFPSQLDLASLNGSNGFAIAGLAAGDELGRVVSQAGDLNDDGIDDIVLGAPQADVNGENSGQAYAIFGSTARFQAAFDLNSLDGSHGFVVNGINAGDNLGSGVSGIGDFNGDGIDDLALGAPDASANGNAESGQSYVIFGRTSQPTIAGDDTDNILAGTDEADTIDAGAGDDRIEAGAGDDTILPGAGRDVVDGGTGNDTVRFAGDRAAFPIQARGDSLRVGDDAAVLREVETLAFNDTTLAVTELKTQLVQVDVGATIAIDLPEPVATDVLNLYSGPSEPSPPDLVLTDSNGEVVPGSIAIDEVGQAVHFVPASGPLPADTYVLTLASRTDGFTSNAAPLDGNGDGEAGGDFQKTFVVEASAARVVSLPDVARGSSQTVQTFDRATQTQSAGLPIFLEQSAGVGRVEFAIDYDPALLQVTGIAADSLPAGWSVVSERVDAVVGAISVTLAGPTLAAGETELARLSATVPDAAIYGDTGVLTFDSLTLNNGAIAATGDAAIQVVSQLGDADGNSNYTAADALAIAQASVGLGTGFAGQLRVNPLVLGDVTGDGTISALDAAIVAAQAERLPSPLLA